jgi:glycerol-3-phosphate acyltransferase PlsY
MPPAPPPPPGPVYEKPSIALAAIGLLLGYLLGSIMVGALVTRRKPADPREGGDYTPDAWNVGDQLGRKPMIYTLLGDFAKGLIAGGLGWAFAAELGVVFATAGAMIGHVFPAYHKFKGGGRPFLPYAGGTLVLGPLPWFISFELFFIAWAAFTLRWAIVAGFASLPVWQLLIKEPDKIAMGTVALLLVLAGGWFWVRRKSGAQELELRMGRAERRAKIADKRAEEAEEKRSDAEEAREEARRIAEEAERLATEAREDARVAEQKIEQEHEPEAPEGQEEAEEARRTAEDARKRARELARE